MTLFYDEYIYFAITIFLWARTKAGNDFLHPNTWHKTKRDRPLAVSLIYI